MTLELFQYGVSNIFWWIGLEHPFWYVNVDTILHTWIAMGCLFILVLVGNVYLRRGSNIPSLIFEESISQFISLTEESFGVFRYDFFSFCAALFFFILACNMIGMVPYLEEPTSDPMTTFAIAIISFLYVQYKKIQIHGLRPFFSEFFEPFFLMFPLNLIGELAKVISMACRLFGNILGGAIVVKLAVVALSVLRGYFIGLTCILSVLYFSLEYLLDLSRYRILKRIFMLLSVMVVFVPALRLFFGIFESFIQAFVVTMLTITYLSIIAPPVAHNKEDLSEEVLV